MAALALDLWNAASGDGRNNFFGIVSEESPPYLVGKRELSHDLIQLGRTAYSNVLDGYLQSLAADYWPDFDQVNPTTPGWTPVGVESWMDNGSFSLPGVAA